MHRGVAIGIVVGVLAMWIWSRRMGASARGE